MLAYLDSFAGMVPCRVLELSRDTARVQFTATRGAYVKGSILDVRTARVVPRAALFRSRQRPGQYGIYAYRWAHILFTGSKL